MLYVNQTNQQSQYSPAKLSTGTQIIQINVNKVSQNDGVQL